MGKEASQIHGQLVEAEMKKDEGPRNYFGPWMLAKNNLQKRSGVVNQRG